MFCRSLFVLLYFFFWPLCCLFFFNIRILITPFVSSKSSFIGGGNRRKPPTCRKKDKQRSTKHTIWTRTSLKTGGELRGFGRVSSSCSTNDTRRVYLSWPPRYNWNIAKSDVKHCSSSIYGFWLHLLYLQTLLLLVEETGGNHRPVASNWQTLSHTVVSSTSRHELESNSQI
jgi:hypothetical protein